MIEKMAKLLSFLQAFVVFVAVTVNGKDVVSFGRHGERPNSLANAGGKVYLDWSCYPGYNAHTELEMGDRGHRAAIFAVHECSKPTEIPGENYCPKTCLLEYHGVLNRIFQVVSNPTKEGFFKKIGKFFNKAAGQFIWLPGGLESAKEITNKILSNCKELMNKYEAKTIKLNEVGCPSELEDCVQKHTSCPI